MFPSLIATISLLCARIIQFNLSQNTPSKAEISFLESPENQKPLTEYFSVPLQTWSLPDWLLFSCNLWMDAGGCFFLVIPHYMLRQWRSVGIQEPVQNSPFYKGENVSCGQLPTLLWLTFIIHSCLLLPTSWANVQISIQIAEANFLCRE